MINIKKRYLIESQRDDLSGKIKNKESIFKKNGKIIEYMMLSVS